MEAAFERKQDDAAPADVSLMRDVDFIPRTYIEEDVSLNDFYTTTDPYLVLELDKVEYTEAMERLSDEERAMLASGKNFYEITFRNEGGLVMPLIVQFEYEDGREEIRRIPAEIWKMSEPTVTKGVCDGCTGHSDHFGSDVGDGGCGYVGQLLARSAAANSF